LRGEISNPVATELIPKIFLEATSPEIVFLTVL